MRNFPIAISYARTDAGKIAHPAANPLRITLSMAAGETLAAPCVLKAELHTSRFVGANTTPLAVVSAAAAPIQTEWVLEFSSAQMNQPTPPEGVRKLWLVVYAAEGSTVLYTFGGYDVDLGWHAISQITPPPPAVPLLAEKGGVAWMTGTEYAAGTMVSVGTVAYVASSAHTSAAATEPGVGANWETVWVVLSGGNTFADLEVTGTLTAPHIHGNLAGSIYSHVRNESGGLLTKGTPVYIVGYSVGQSRPLIAAAASGNPASMPAIGILDADLANNASGHCVVFGTIENLNTSAYSVNAPLYVASAGGLTAAEPSARIQPIAQVERVNANNGSILVLTALYSSLAQQSASAVSITGGSITGLTNLTSTIGTITGSTASISTTTGALVVTGGVGIGGALNVGADSFINGVRVGRSLNALNTVLGSGALNVVSTGSGNVAIGTNALVTATTATSNIAIGNGALGGTTDGIESVAIGSGSLQSATTGQNTAVGRFTLTSITSGGLNVALGHDAGRRIVAGTVLTSINNSVLIGADSRPLNATGDTNEIVIGHASRGDGSNTTVIGTTSTTQSRLYGGDAFNTGANGQSNVFGQASTPLTGFTGASRTATALIPANCIVIGVSCRVTTAITGATSFDIGDGTTANLFASAVPVALGSTSNLVIAPKVYATATNVVCAANGSNFTAGAVRLTVHYMRIVAPTS
jgi:hypothetical protein